MQTWPMIKMLLTSPGFQVSCTGQLLADSLQPVHVCYMSCVLSASWCYLTSRALQAVTWASAMNDVGSWALVAWQATFYQVGDMQACTVPLPAGYYRIWGLL